MSDQKICPTCGTEYPLSERFCPRDGTALRSANVQADLLGSIIADRYHILKKLGEGGMGTVYLAEHVKMGRKSALKVMNPGMNTDPDAIARFNREASNASRLNHPNICGIYDFGETSDGIIYLAMEYIEGSSLTGLIEKTGAMPAPRTGSIIHQTADALQVAHDAGIVHRDLKPDNIMVARHRDGSDLVKVVDFGIAKASSSDAQKVTKTGLVVGTPEYMSPEQLAGDKLDGRSDIYSLGLVAFNCLTGKLPFPAETVQEAMIMRLTDKPRTLAETKPDVAWPAELQRTLDKALERDSTLRYHSAAHFGREFAEAISAMPATQAAEAGTLVMGSVAAPPVRDVPATRVRPSSGATVPVEAVPAPVAAKAAAPRPVAAPAAAKSKTPMIAGAGALVAIAAVGLFMFTPWKADGTGSASPDPATVSSQPPATPAGTNDSLEQFSKNAVETPQVDPGTALNPPAPVGTRPQSETKSTAPAPIPANPVNVVADTSDEGANPTLISPRLLRLHEIVTDTLTTEPALRTAIQHSRRIRRNPNLSRMLTADTWYIEMMAFGALFGLHGETDSDRSGACRAAGVIRRHPNPQRASGVKQTVDALDCPAP